MTKAVNLLLVFVGLTLQVPGQTSPRFEDYPVAIYRGSIQRPKWIQLVADDEWRDELGKLVEPPVVNFAGRYFVSYIAAVPAAGTIPSRIYPLAETLIS